MQPNSELFRLKELLLEALAASGCLPWRDLESVEVDLTGGELILRPVRKGLELFPLVARFCRANGLEVLSWDPEEKECHLRLRPASRRVETEGEHGVRLPAAQGRRPREQADLRRAYRAAVRRAFDGPQPLARVEAGRLAWALGKFGYAQTWFEDALAGPESERLEAMLWLGFCHHRGAGQGDRKALFQARACYEAVLAEDPGSFHALLNLGKLAELEQRPEAARTCYRLALALRPEDQEAARLLGRLETGPESR